MDPVPVACLPIADHIPVPQNDDESGVHFTRELSRLMDMDMQERECEFVQRAIQSEKEFEARAHAELRQQAGSWEQQCAATYSQELAGARAPRRSRT